MTTYQIGDHVMYRGCFGTAGPLHCKITGIGEKNGQPVYDNDLDHWGYADQYEPERKEVE